MGSKKRNLSFTFSGNISFFTFKKNGLCSEKVVLISFLKRERCSPGSTANFSLLSIQYRKRDTFSSESLFMKVAKMPGFRLVRDCLKSWNASLWTSGLASIRIFTSPPQIASSSEDMSALRLNSDRSEAFFP